VRQSVSASVRSPAFDTSTELREIFSTFDRFSRFLRIHTN